MEREAILLKQINVCCFIKLAASPHDIRLLMEVKLKQVARLKPSLTHYFILFFYAIVPELVLIF